MRHRFMFEVGDHLFATDVRNVKEVLELADTTPIPGSVPGVLGLINVRGTMVVAADMATLLGLTSRGSPETALVLLEAGGRRVALRVDRVSGITGEAGPDLDVEGELLEALGVREVTLGVGRIGSRPYYELDVDAVFGRVLEPDREEGEGEMSQRVLIVDDAIFMRTMIGDILKQAGFDIVGEASNGVEAVEKYKELNPDLVTMDIVMPDMGGIDAVKEIIKVDPDARILMCSAMGQQGLVVEAIQAGARDFVVKPFQPSRVLEAIQRLLA